jgi:hypothetical protein
VLVLYQIDLQNNIQTNMYTGYQRKVIRKDDNIVTPHPFKIVAEGAPVTH